MKYLCLIFDEQEAVGALPPDTRRALERCMGQHVAALRRNGEALLSAALQAGGAAATVRRRNGRLQISDSPHAAAHEPLGGVVLFEATDLNDAIRIASHLPVAPWATLEIRPVDADTAAEPPGERPLPSFTDERTRTMTTQLQPYLFLEGRCEEAIEFYRKALGAEVRMLMRNRESPEPSPPGTLPPGAEDKVLHAEIAIDGATVLMSDGYCSGKPAFAGVALTLISSDPATNERRFGALQQGGNVTMPLSKTFFSPSFGMLTDRFGVMWMLYTANAA